MNKIHALMYFYNMRLSKIFLVSILVLISCEDTECQPGGEGCKCIPENSELLQGGFCEAGLECFQNRCVRPWSHGTIDQQLEMSTTSHMDVN
jgi:hypothetical protein